jgi:hypothetical protein
MAKTVLDMARFCVVDAQEEPIDFLSAIDTRAEMNYVLSERLLLRQTLRYRQRAHSKSYLKITTERS